MTHSNADKNKQGNVIPFKVRVVKTRTRAMGMVSGQTTGALKFREEKATEHKDKSDSKRPIQAILKDYVEILPDHIGLKIDDKIPLDESLSVLGWAMALSDHAGFMIGDIINHGEQTFGESKYTEAIARTGRALSTLKNYAWVARTFPPEKRLPALTFSHHEEMARLGGPDHREQLIKEVIAQVEEGEEPTVKELRAKVKKLKPLKQRKKRQPKPPPKPKLAHEERRKMNLLLDGMTLLWARVQEFERLFSLLENKKKWAAKLRPFADWLDDSTK